MYVSSFYLNKMMQHFFKKSLIFKKECFKFLMDMLYVSGTSPVIKVALKNSKHQTNKCTIFYFFFLLQKGNIYLLKSFIVTNLFTKSFVLYSAYQTSSFNFLAKDEKRKS